MVSETESGSAGAKHHRGTTMEHYAGIDVSLESASVCVVDGAADRSGGKIASEPDALIAWSGALGMAMTRIGLEAGPLSQWLYAAHEGGGLRGGADGDAACPRCLQGDAGEDRSQGCPRDRPTDAAGLVPAGSLQVAACAGSARAADGTQAAAEQAARRRDKPARRFTRLRLEGGQTTPRTFEARIRELVDGHPTLCSSSPRRCWRRAPPVGEFKALEKRLRRWRAPHARRAPHDHAWRRHDRRAHVSSAIDDPAVFGRRVRSGAHFGLTPGKYQSGETDVTGRISKIGDRGCEPRSTKPPTSSSPAR